MKKVEVDSKYASHKISDSTKAIYKRVHTHHFIRWHALLKLYFLLTSYKLELIRGDTLMK